MDKPIRFRLGQEDLDATVRVARAVLEADSARDRMNAVKAIADMHESNLRQTEREYQRERPQDGDKVLIQIIDNNLDSKKTLVNAITEKIAKLPANPSPGVDLPDHEPPGSEG